MHSTTSTEDPRPPPPQIPPSPTLSNPDMILPFDLNERESSTPSPPFNLPSLSHLQSFYENRPYPNDYSMDLARNGAPVSVGGRQKGFPRHTWLHEGHDAASRRLSDIGEEDNSSPGYLSGFVDDLHGPHVAGSPVIQHSNEDMESAEWSSSSSSTVSAASESSIERNRNQQNSYGQDQSAEHIPWQETARAIHNGVGGDVSRSSTISTTEEGGPADELSSVILSSEAERILDNAKRRLTLMEGNLTRARSSMRMSPSLSASPTPSAGSPQMGLGQPETANNRHSRVYSETRLPSADQSRLTGVDSGLSRSLSALGSSSTSNFNNDERSFRYEPTRAYLTHRASVSSMHRPRLSPSSLGEQTSSDKSQGLGISTEEDKENRVSSVDEFNSTYPQQDPPSRSQSQLHVRDLQDQMKGLHIKISSLKVKTQEDNLRRRSLQSLRTPSPFTAADQWYTNEMELKDSNSSSPNRERGRAPHSQGHPQPSESSRAREIFPSGHNEAEESSADNSSSGIDPASHDDYDDDDAQSVIESLYEDAIEGEYYRNSWSGSDIDREALNEILREPLDDDLQDPLDQFPAVPHATDATPHEDRADAFDYEHFILHSALGNFTQSRTRRSSNASNTSVETTRPIQNRRSARHSRANSGASLSTVATFATAAEAHDDIDSVLYWDRKFNDELRHRYPESEMDPQFHSSGSDSETMRTPRGTRRQSSRKSKPDPSQRMQWTPQRPESSMTNPATPTSLASSLVSTVRAASSPHPNSAGSGNMGINDDDTRLLEQLFQSLGNVCMDLQTITTSLEPDEKQARLLRRRLDAARRALDGELDA
ncbi:hypothetical protein FE257_007509 [Aspergillus nanangensis]|uniref:Uncharacterized protein n=1 Tax=Aspergillus nanangensis TaxID=2582783 RepID=A0AAD4GU10_ASPNN|nr:hypothetical protein FE257_007509 [Aspergillus nanangensis]